MNLINTPITLFENAKNKIQKILENYNFEEFKGIKKVLIKYSSKFRKNEIKKQEKAKQFFYDNSIHIPYEVIESVEELREKNEFWKINNSNKFYKIMISSKFSDILCKMCEEKLITPSDMKNLYNKINKLFK